MPFGGGHTDCSSQQDSGSWLIETNVIEPRDERCFSHGTPIFSGKPHIPHVIPAKAGIHRQYEAWIPAFAGMT
ncbi:hypothetical protein GCM10011408_05950 [Dyella caseinilytica]|nr:hypothetical protein GCM10011408_05950 [Dyella caseinilytica]